MIRTEKSREPVQAADPRTRWGLRGWMGDSALMVSTQALATLATSALAVVIARTLDPEGFGLFSAFLSLSQALAILIEMGLATFLLRELSAGDWASLRERARLTELLSSALLASAILAGGALIATLGFMIAFSTPVERLVVLVALLTNTSFLAMASLLQSVARSERRLKIIVRVTVIEKFALLGGTVGVVYAGLGMSGIAFVYAATGFGHLALLYYLTHRYLGLTIVRPRVSEVIATVRSAIPFTVSRTALNVGPRLDVVLVATVSISAAGSFAVGDRIVGSVLFVPAVLGSTMYPFLAKVTHDRERYVRWTSILMAACGTGIAASGALLAPIAIPWIFGQKYSSAILTVQLMLASLPFIFISNGLLAQLFQSEREKAVATWTVIASVAGLLAVGVGAIVAGAEGAAAGFTARQVLFTIALALLGFRWSAPSGEAAALSDSGIKKRT